MELYGGLQYKKNMIYTIIINNRQVFSDCKAIQMPDGIWISNPSAEQIADAGWVKYVPPTIEGTPQTEPDYNEVVDALKRMFSTDIIALSDKEALGMAALYPTWISKVGQDVAIDERLWYNGKLWKCVQAHTAQEDWTPDTAASLYTEVSIVEWPEWVQPTGVQDAYNTGDKVTYNSGHYISKIDNNTWSPSDYPSGWEEVND